MSDRLPPPALLALGTVVLAATVTAILVRPAPSEIEALFADGGTLGPALFVLAYSALTIFLAPGAPLTIASGALYGVTGGAFLSVVGATIGATAAYGISRRSTRASVDRVRGDRLAAIEARLHGRGLTALLVLRLIPVVPFNALNYAAGASAIGTRDYVVATGFGIVPGAIVYAALGAGLDNPVSPLFLGAAIAAVLLALVTRSLTRSDGRGVPGIAAGLPPASSAPPRDTDRAAVKTLAWSAAFFLAALGIVTALTVGGLFH